MKKTLISTKLQQFKVARVSETQTVLYILANSIVYKRVKQRIKSSHRFREIPTRILSTVAIHPFAHPKRESKCSIGIREPTRAEHASRGDARKFLAGRATSPRADRSCCMEKYTVYGSEDFSARQCVSEIESMSSSSLSKVSIQRDSLSAKLVTEKCDKARNLVKLSAGPGRVDAPTPATLSTCIQILGKYPGYPAGEKRADNTFSESSCCRCRCNFKDVCLPGRVGVTRARKRPRSLFATSLKNISRRARYVETPSAYYGSRVLRAVRARDLALRKSQRRERLRAS